MAIHPRSSRPLVVRGMSFRWRQRGDHLAVWHTLDEGLLTVRLPVHEEIPGPLMVARIVERALEAGWRTVEHRELELTTAEWQALSGLAPATRWIGSRDLGEVLAQTRVQLGISEPTGLQVVYLPATAAPLAITASLSGALQVDGVSGGDVSNWRVPVAPELPEDLLVTIMAVSPTASPPGRPRCPGAVRVAGPTSWHAQDELSRGTGRARELAVRLWRLAREHVADPDAQTVLRAVQVDLEPGEPPLELDPSTRTVTVYGRWNGDALARSLAALDAPWTIDARSIQRVAGSSDTLRRWARRNRLLHVWRGEETLLNGELSLGVRIARRSRDVAGLRDEGARVLLERLVLRRMDPRWSVRAGEWLTSTDPETRRRALLEVDRWIGPGWEVDPGGTGIAGFWFVPQLVGWREGLPGAGLVIRPDRAWLVTASGEVLTTT